MLSLLRDVREELASVRLQLLGPSDASVFVNGRRTRRWTGSSFVLRLNAGPAVISAEADGVVPARRTLELNYGEDLVLALDEMDERHVRQDPKFWVILVTGLLLAAGATATIVIARTRERSLAHTGPFGVSSEEI